MMMKKTCIAALTAALLISLLCSTAFAATFHQSSGTAPAPYGNTTTSNYNAVIRFQESKFYGGQNFAVTSAAASRSSCDGTSYRL